MKSKPKAAEVRTDCSLKPAGKCPDWQRQKQPKATRHQGKSVLGGGCIVKTHSTRGVSKAQQLGERHATVSPGHLSPANPWCRVSGVWKMNKFCCWKPFHLWCLLWSTTQIHGIRNFESRESYQKIVMHTQVWEPPLPILVLSKNNPGMLKQQQQKIKINKKPQTFGLSS